VESGKLGGKFVGRIRIEEKFKICAIEFEE
jgi:hypothetical protein